MGGILVYELSNYEVMQNNKMSNKSIRISLTIPCNFLLIETDNFLRIFIFNLLSIHPFQYSPRIQYLILHIFL